MTYQERINAKANEIELLTAYANGVTGQTDTNIGDAIRTLCDGFGGGIVFPPEMGMSKMWMGTLDVDTPTPLPTITHGLGVVPKVFFMWLNATWDATSGMPGQTNDVCVFFAINPTQSSKAELYSAGKIINNNNVPNLKFRNTYDGKIWTYADRISLHGSSTSLFSGRYNIIAMA